MAFLSNLIGLFAVTADEDISADEVFKQSFLNVVNFFLLAFSLVIGTHALFREIASVALYNYAASIFFVSYFIFAYLLKRTAIYVAIDKVVIFIYFILVMLSSSVTRLSEVPLLMYPFLAIILHGRRMGVILALSQIFISVALYVGLQMFMPSLGLDYELYELFALVVTQCAATFVFLSTIRWMSSIIYDKIREVVTLTEDVKVQKQLTEHLSQSLRITISDIERCSQRMASSNLSTAQSQMLSTIRVAAGSMNQKMDSVLNASKYCIRPLGDENIVFNLHVLVTNVLMLYGTSIQRMEQGHSVVLSSEMPQNVMGNSMVTKQILLSIFDALDQKVGLKDKTLVTTLSMCDTNAQNLVVNFAISLYVHLNIDHRELTSTDQKLINNLNLRDSYRLIEATKSNFAIEYINNVLTIQFTQPYQDVDAIVIPDKDLLEEKRTFNELIRNNQGVLKIGDMSMVIVSFDDVTDRFLLEAFLGKLAKVEIAASARSALNRFENSRVDILVISLSQYYEMSALELVRRVRDIERGVGRRSIVISLDQEPVRGDAKLAAMEAGVDLFAIYPTDVATLHTTIKELLDN